METNKTEYLSFNTVLSMRGVMKHIPYTSSYATILKEVPLETEKTVHYQVPEKFFFGFNSIKLGGLDLLVAEPEKAFLDLLYLVEQGKQDLDFSELDLELLSKEKLDEYSIKMGIDYKKHLREYKKTHIPTPFDYDIPKDLAA